MYGWTLLYTIFYVGILRWATYRVGLLCTYIRFLSQGQVLSKKAVRLRQQQSAFRDNRAESNATVRLESSSGSQIWLGTSIFSSLRRSSLTPPHPAAPAPLSSPPPTPARRRTESLKMIMNPLSLSRPSSINISDPPRPSSMNRPIDGQCRSSSSSSLSSLEVPAINVPPMEIEGVSNDNDDKRFQYLLETTTTMTDSNRQSSSNESIHIPEGLRPRSSRTVNSSDLEHDSWTMERLISIELTEMMYQIHSFSTVGLSSSSSSSRGSSLGRHLSGGATHEASMTRRTDQQQQRQLPPSQSSSSSMKTSFFSWWR